jgi:hypothetical protein
MGKVHKWEDLDAERKFELLDFWFYYYGGVPITWAEWKVDFKELAETYADQIFDYIITSFLFQKTIQTNLLVASMRAGKVKELFDSVINYSTLEEEDKKKIDPVRCSILEEIEESFAHPKPPVPMDIAIVVETGDGPKPGGK